MKATSMLMLFAAVVVFYLAVMFSKENPLVGTQVNKITGFLF